MLLIGLVALLPALLGQAQAVAPGTAAHPLNERTEAQARLRGDSLGGADSYTVRDNLLRLATVQERAGQYAAAYENYRRYNALKDSIFTRETAARLTEVETRYRTQQQRRQLQKQQLLLRTQRADLSRKNQLLGFGLTSAVVLLLGAGALAWLARQRIRTNRLLAATHAEIRQTAAQRELLVEEVHERVKSNLRMVSHLLEWQPTDSPDAPIVRAAMVESQARIQAMALVHENLYRADEQAQIRLDTYLGQLIEALHAAHTAAHCPVRLTTSLAPLVLGAQEAVPFGLMVNEILTNVYKHAFRGRTAGHLHVSLEASAAPPALPAPGTAGPGPAFRLVVADDGVGLPAPAAAASAPARPPSLGMQLVRLLSRQLRATLSTGAGVEGGARFEIRRGVWGLLPLMLSALLFAARPLPTAAQAAPPATATAEPPMSRAQQIDKRAEEALATNPDLALRLARQAEAVAVAEHDTLERAWAVTNIGSAYFVREQYALALNAYWRALNLHEANRDPDGQAACLNDLANLCFSHKQFDAALRYYGRSLQLYRQMGDSLGVAALYINLANVESALHHLATSLRNGQRALALLRGAQEPDEEAKALTNVGTVLLELHRNAEAVPYLEEALQITTQQHNISGQATSLKALGNAHRELHHTARAVAYYTDALRVGRQFGRVVRDTHRQLAELHAQAGDYQAATASYRRYIVLKDSIFSREVSNQVAELETRYRTRQQRRQLEVQRLTLEAQQAAIARTRQQTRLAFSMAALLLLSAGGLTHQIRRRTQANQRLTAATEEVRQGLLHKEMLIQEIHHRVKNNLQMVSSLLKWQADAHPAIQAAVEVSQDRIQALALLHEHMYRGDDLTQVRLDAYLTQLLNTLREAYDQTGSGKIHLTTELAPLSLRVREASAFAMLISEVLTIACKHAFRESSRGHLYVALDARGVSGFHLRLSVNGVRMLMMPGGAAPPWSAGLDPQLVQTFSRELGATLHTAPNGQAGIHIELIRESV